MRVVRELLRNALVIACLLVPLAALGENPQVRLRTDLGDILIELYPEKAPVTVQNFLDLVAKYHYDGLIFHRVIPGFVVQSGGFTFDLSYRDTGVDPIVNESGNGLLNSRGSVAMARLSEPDSARAQFFINLADNKTLDPKGKKAGYTVFGRVIGGMDVVDEIAEGETEDLDNFRDLPVEPVFILSARLLNPDSLKSPAKTVGSVAAPTGKTSP